jgi:transketolase
MVELAPMRQAYGEALVELGRADPDVVVLTADVQTSDFSFLFGEAFPDRYINVGIAEMALVDVSVGLANAGKTPYPNTFAVFIASRAFEPVLTHLAYGQANVKLMAGYSGLSPQMEGPTHHAITDIAVMRALPNMAVVSPADAVAMRALLPQVHALPGPVYYRFCRNEVPVVFGDDYAPRIGQAWVARRGSDVTLIGSGTLLSRCLSAADELAGRGIDARVLDMHTIKPLDTEAVLAAAHETGAIVTAEEHSIIGGLGAAVAEVVTDAGLGVAVKRVGLADCFAGSGPYYDMLDAYGMSVADVVAAAEAAIALKRGT